MVLVNLSKTGKEQETQEYGLTHEYRIEVIDKGPGIPEVDQLKIFKPFFRSSDRDSELSYESNGLGLSICH